VLHVSSIDGPNALARIRTAAPPGLPTGYTAKGRTSNQIVFVQENSAVLVIVGQWLKEGTHITCVVGKHDLYRYA
jgi:hypothetical protein